MIRKYEALEGEYEHKYKIGDKITYKGESLYVGDDWQELNYWVNGNTKDYIVTSCGRVLSITEIRRDDCHEGI